MKIGLLTWRWLGLMLWVGLLATNSRAGVTVVVDDTAANDSAYVNGAGGNFSGTAALKNALAAVLADDPANGPFGINLIDTNGGADTYSGSLYIPVTAPQITIRQVANGNGNDVGVTIAGDASLLRTIHVDGSHFTLSGLSSAVPITLDGAATDQGAGTTLSNPEHGGETNLWENLRYINCGTWDHMDLDGTPNNSGATAQVFRHCSFSSALGADLRMANTRFENCTFHTTGHYLVARTGTHLVAAGCSFSGASAGLNLDAAAAALFSDCSFNNSGGPLLFTLSPTGTDVQFVRPTFTGSYPTPALRLVSGGGAANSPSTVTLQGDPASKLNLDPLFSGGSQGLARFLAGTVQLKNCTASIRPGQFFIDCAGGALTANVLVSMDGCDWNNSGDFIANVQNACAFKVDFSARNTIWRGTSPAPALVQLNGEQTVDGSISLTHCTMVAATPSVLLNGRYNFAGSAQTRNDVLSANYCIFDAAGTVAGAASGQIALTGTRNISRHATAGALGGFLPGEPSDTLDLDPLLNTSGHLLPNSPAIDAALGSLLTNDVDGDARPLGAANDIGADEAQSISSVAPTIWSLFM